MTCDRTAQLHAYHDGQLDAAASAEMERHLAACGECAEALAELRATSALFAATPRPRLSQMSQHRLHRHVEAAIERGLVRFAWSLSGAAAAVLLVGSIWLSHTKEPPQAAPPWVEAVAFAHPIDTGVQTPAAQWYLADASTRSDDLP
jgi:anti-sigma factor RsiW